MNDISIVELTTEHIGPMYIIKARAERPGAAQIAIEAVYLGTSTGEAMAAAIREASEKAKARAIQALVGEAAQADGWAERLPPAKVSDLGQAGCHCRCGRQIGTLKVWDKGVTLRLTEGDLTALFKALTEHPAKP
jgi:hypothetical protein